MKISIITTTFNSEKTVEETILSVINQTYGNIEYIIADGGSTDKTLEIVNKYKDRISKIGSGSDNGVYDAMNKGIKMATGDIIGFLNSDDIFFDNKVVETIAEEFEKYNPDCLWGDLLYTAKNDLYKNIRFWKSSDYKDDLFETGWVPPHPTFYVKKEIYEKYGIFNLDFKIAADYELMFRLLKKYKIKSKYIPKTFVRMRVGGFSHKNKKQGNLECIKAWRVNGFKMPFYTPIFRIFRRLLQMLFKSQFLT